MEVRVKEKGDLISIRWFLSKIEIPKKDIVNVYESSEYGGDSSVTHHIGQPYARADRVIIQTKDAKYLIYTNNGASILEKLNNN
ncbi:PH domain-containing protein [Halobacillus sp. Nhm2S1]|uniref:PH domain-containing protein n=1 Tax=Halobacillus sp. Nhm2S1 TaxID=2866716 RepID=UPI001C732F31|nr:PH domain-containing protein [Halobacillus sp. Nhm2S1]MBX0358477.1 PH domain-containing protein [Halobacillus sp. Nhm2S1]